MLRQLLAQVTCVASRDKGRRLQSHGDPSFARLEDEKERLPQSVAPTPPLVLVAFLFPAFAGFNFGFDIGSTGGAVQQLQALPGASLLADSPLMVGLLTSGSLFGTVIGTALSFVLANPLGRRGELLLAGMLYFVGTCVAVFATGENLLLFVFAGRVIYGIGIALAM